MKVSHKDENRTNVLEKTTDETVGAVETRLVNLPLSPWQLQMRPSVVTHVGCLGRSNKVEAISPGHALSAVLPPSNTELLDGSYARALSKIKLGPLRVQATICNAVLKQSHHMLRKAVLQPFDAVDMTPSDSAHILAVTSRGQLTRVLSSCLWYKEHRMGPKEFIAWFRFHYNLPQLLRGDTLRMVAGTAMTTCCATQQCIEEEALLDPQLEHT